LSHYTDIVRASQPTWFWPLLGSDTPLTHVNVGITPLPNGDLAARYLGIGSYSEAPDDPRYSIDTTGVLTIQAWIKPNPPFPKLQSTGYVHWMGKGRPGEHEWTFRMYDEVTSDEPPRPNRISGYAFNPEGGLGVGAYFQDSFNWDLPEAEQPWIHVVLILDTHRGRATIYRDGVLRNSQRLDKYGIQPRNGSAPVRVGTRDHGSYFVGGIGMVAGWDRELGSWEIEELYSAMLPANG
jgi:hypothetical protein